MGEEVRHVDVESKWYLVESSEDVLWNVDVMSAGSVVPLSFSFFFFFSFARYYSISPASFLSYPVQSSPRTPARVI